MKKCANNPEQDCVGSRHCDKCKNSPAYKMGFEFGVNFANPLNEEDFGTLCICAERYALGRRSYMPTLIRNIIIGHGDMLSQKDIHVLIKDISNPLWGDYGDECDKAVWMDLLEYLKVLKGD